MEGDVPAGGCIIDWHACDLFPKSWIDLVVVLRVDSTTLYDRLKARYLPALFFLLPLPGNGVTELDLETTPRLSCRRT
jgi:hypothetical protein